MARTKNPAWQKLEDTRLAAEKNYEEYMRTQHPENIRTLNAKIDAAQNAMRGVPEFVGEDE